MHKINFSVCGYDWFKSKQINIDDTEKKKEHFIQGILCYVPLTTRLKCLYM